MLHLGDFEFGILSLKDVGVDDRCFVSQVFRAFVEMLGEVLFGLILQDMPLVVRDRIPELRLTIMEVVYSREFQVFSVPAKQSFPGSNVTIRCVYSFNWNIKGVRENRFQVGKVPR